MTSLRPSLFVAFLLLSGGFAESAEPAATSKAGDLASLKAQALASTKKALDPVLKAPSTARYAVAEVSKLEPSAVFAQGRYQVDMTVDAQNSFGVPLRSTAEAVFKEKDGGWVLLSFDFTSSGGEARRLYLAPATERLRPEVVKFIRNDFKRRAESMAKAHAGKPVGIVPRAKPKNGRKMSKKEKDEDARLTASVAITFYRERFGLSAEECLEVLGIE